MRRQDSRIEGSRVCAIFHLIFFFFGASSLSWICIGAFLELLHLAGVGYTASGMESKHLQRGLWIDVPSGSECFFFSCLWEDNTAVRRMLVIMLVFTSATLGIEPI